MLLLSFFSGKLFRIGLLCCYWRCSLRVDQVMVRSQVVARRPQHTGGPRNESPQAVPPPVWDRRVLPTTPNHREITHPPTSPSARSLSGHPSRRRPSPGSNHPGSPVTPWNEPDRPLTLTKSFQTLGSGRTWTASLHTTHHVRTLLPQLLLPLPSLAPTPHIKP